MGNLLGVLFLISLGFLAGWRYGYKEVTGDIERVVDRVLNRRRP
jgi:hypothetical protein